MIERQTKFGRPDVNDAADMDRLVLQTMAVGSPKAQILGCETAALSDNALRTTRFTLCSGYAGAVSPFVRTSAIIAVNSSTPVLGTMMLLRRP